MFLRLMLRPNHFRLKNIKKQHRDSDVTSIAAELRANLKVSSSDTLGGTIITSSSDTLGGTILICTTTY